jgi:hypothetical protein
MGRSAMKRLAKGGALRAYPTSAKTGQMWGTREWKRVESERREVVTEGKEGEVAVWIG